MLRKSKSSISAFNSKNRKAGFGPHCTTATVYGGIHLAPFETRPVTRHRKSVALAIRNVDLAYCKFKMRRAIRKLINIWKLCKVHKSTADIPLNFDSTMSIFKDSQSIHKSAQSELKFDLSTYKEPKNVPDYVKKLFKLSIDQRTEDVMKIAANGLSALVPQFQEYPYEIRLSIVKYAQYEEYEPGRVILRQGFKQYNFYFLIQGICAATKVYNSFDAFVEFYSRGHSLGENELIHKSRRKTTISTTGTKNVCFLSIHRDDFFRIIKPLSEPMLRIRFLSKYVPILNSLSYPFKDMKLAIDSDCCGAYFRSGVTICNDGSTDDWLYVVKAGSCKVLKKIKIRKSSKDTHVNFKTKSHLFKTTDEFFDNMRAKTSKGDERKADDENKEQTVCLELEELKKGDVYGLKDLVFNDILEPNSTMLVSCGVECVLISRKMFLKELSKPTEMKLKVTLMPYPSEDELIPSYFEYIDWIKFKKQNLKNTIVKNK